NGGCRPGDALVLTKPLGTGVLATAMKAGLIPPHAERRAVEVMAALNRRAAEVMSSYPVHACTDVTGFGLLGHAREMAAASQMTLVLEVDRVPFLPESLESAQMGLVPAGSFSNRNSCSRQVLMDRAVDPVLLDLLADAQTSGGLLISVDGSRGRDLVEDLHGAGCPDAALIGRVLEPGPGIIRLV
ncbi:MAG TPA: selenide, water dikinase SelD, partial [Syntrophobacteraceae bacterium]|nr:selenide, water dikinase SelD [Syntrophobacteraceae bacterium]